MAQSAASAQPGPRNIPSFLVVPANARGSGKVGCHALRWAPAFEAVKRIGTGSFSQPLSRGRQFGFFCLLPFGRHSRESGNLGISVTCPGPRFRGGDEFACPQDFLTAFFAG